MPGHGKYQSKDNNMAGQPKDIQADKVRRQNEQERQIKARKSASPLNKANNKQGRGQR